MNAENEKRNDMSESRLPWGVILAGAVLLLASLGGLIYFFVISAP